MFVLLIVFFVTRIRCSSHLASSSYSLSRCIVPSHHCRRCFSTLASGFRFLWLFICFVSSTSLCNRCPSRSLSALTDSGDLVSGIGTLSIVVEVASPGRFHQFALRCHSKHAACGTDFESNLSKGLKELRLCRLTVAVSQPSCCCYDRSTRRALSMPMPN